MSVQSFIKWTILIACLVSTGFAEWDLAVWLGGNPYVACALPLVTDLYLIHATRNGVDTVPAVLVVIAVNAFDHTHTLMADWAKIPLSILIASLAPLVLWRLHATERSEKPQGTVSEPVERPVTDWVPAIVPVPQTEPEPAPEPEPTADPEPEPEPAATELTDDERDTVLYDYWVRNRRAKDAGKKPKDEGVSADDAAQAAGCSAATVYRAWKEFSRPVNA